MTWQMEHQGSSKRGFCAAEMNLVILGVADSGSNSRPLKKIRETHVCSCITYVYFGFCLRSFPLPTLCEALQLLAEAKTLHLCSVNVYGAAIGACESAAESQWDVALQLCKVDTSNGQNILLAMASNLLAMASNLLAMASNLLAVCWLFKVDQPFYLCRN